MAKEIECIEEFARRGFEVKIEYPDGPSPVIKVSREFDTGCSVSISSHANDIGHALAKLYETTHAMNKSVNSIFECRGRISVNEARAAVGLNPI